jgi:hypothetical protein
VNRRAWAPTSRLGWSLAAINMLIFALMLASKTPEYAELRERDERFASTGDFDWSSADPMHLAGRPFYSSVHVANVPLVEDLYFIANTPAMVAALSVSYPVARVTFAWWTGSPTTSSAWDSWTRALVFGSVGIAWAYLVGALIERLRGRRAQDHDAGSSRSNAPSSSSVSR